MRDTDETGRHAEMVDDINTPETGLLRVIQGHTPKGKGTSGSTALF